MEITTNPIAEPVYPIVAFMQNPWFKQGTKQRTIDLYRTNQDYHQRVLSMCMSGRRLRCAFKELYSQIWWDNANPEPVLTACGRRDPDTYHMIGVICKIRPRIVVSVGASAHDGMIAIDKMEHEIRLPHYIHMNIHHPNARGKTQYDLNEFADQVRAKLKELLLSEFGHRATQYL